MSILVYIDSNKGQVKKASLEAVSYAGHIASSLGTTTTAIVVNADDNAFSLIADAGADNILSVKDEKLNNFNIKGISETVSKAADAESAVVLVFPYDGSGLSVAPYVAALKKAGIIAGATAYPEIKGDSFEIQKNVFSGKATAIYSLDSAIKVISLLPNSLPVEKTGKAPQVESFSSSSEDSNPVVLKNFKVNDDVAHGGIPLPDAELVVSGGRGLKGPENWGIIEDLAHTLGAATACSRPVADADWRPHHEHVGQTGLAIRPNLYIAIGISGAIQHLAGVNGSKTIVVINNDPEAPFFKNADYGIIGDAFTIVPKLTEAIKKLKAS